MPKLTKVKIQEWQENLKAESEHRNDFHKIVLDYLTTISKEEAVKSISVFKEENVDWINNKGGLVFKIEVKDYDIDIKSYDCDNEYITTYITETGSSKSFNYSVFAINQNIVIFNNKLKQSLRKDSIRVNALKKLSQEEIEALELNWCE